jgi:hypothetical protein
MCEKVYIAKGGGAIFDLKKGGFRATTRRASLPGDQACLDDFFENFDNIDLIDRIEGGPTARSAMPKRFTSGAFSELPSNAPIL